MASASSRLHSGRSRRLSLSHKMNRGPNVATASLRWTATCKAIFIHHRSYLYLPWKWWCRAIRERYLQTYGEAHSETPPFSDLFQGQVKLNTMSSCTNRCVKNLINYLCLGLLGCRAATRAAGLQSCYKRTVPQSNHAIARCCELGQSFIHDWRASWWATWNFV